MSKRLRVAVVVSHFPCVSQTFVLDHITGLLERGHDVQVFAQKADNSPRHGDQLNHELQSRTHYWPRSSEYRRRQLWDWMLGLWQYWQYWRSAVRTRSNATLSKYEELRRDLRSVAKARYLLEKIPDVDIVHAHFAYVGDAMARASRLGVGLPPLLTSIHGIDVLGPATQANGGYPELFQRSARVLVTTQFMAERVVALGCPVEKVAQRPLGIRLEDFTWRAPAEFSDNGLRVLSVSRLVEKKGIEFALRAVALARQRGLKVQYTVVGDGPLNKKLVQLASDLGIKDATVFVGAQPREAVRKMMYEHHALLMPSVTAGNGDQEGQGMVALESQACGLPVIGTWHGGIPEVVAPDLVAWLCPERDSKAMAAVLVLLSQSAEQSEDRSRRISAWVHENFSHSAYIDFVEAHYRQVLEGRA